MEEPDERKAERKNKGKSDLDEFYSAMNDRTNKISKLTELEYKLKNSKSGAIYSALELLGICSKEKRIERLEDEIDCCSLELKLLKNFEGYLNKKSA
jgi:uncharacterized small protein (DUF1192 family)